MNECSYVAKFELSIHMCIQVLELATPVSSVCVRVNIARAY